MTLREIVCDIKSDRKKKVILDTDTYNEIDDQYALAYCYFSERIDLVAVHAAPFDNDNSENYADGMEKSYHEIHRVLKAADPEYTTPVMRGCTERITDKRAVVESEAVDNLIRIVRESDEIVYVLGIGAITNVTSAIMKAPDIINNMAVIWLGAHQLDLGHINEFNLTQDIAASQILVNSGVPLLLCPAVSVTGVLVAKFPMIEELKGQNPVCDLLYDLTEEYYEGAGRPDNWIRILWDIAAPAIIDCPQSAEIDIIKAPVFTDDLKFAFDSTRHEIMYLRSLDRQTVFDKTWETLKKGK